MVFSQVLFVWEGTQKEKCLKGDHASVFFTLSWEGQMKIGAGFDM